MLLLSHARSDKQGSAKSENLVPSDRSVRPTRVESQHDLRSRSGARAACGSATL